MHCVWLQGQNKIRANAFVWSTHTFAAVQQLIGASRAKSCERDWSDRTRLHLPPPPPLAPPAQLPIQPFRTRSTCHCHIGFVAGAACCLVTGRSELDIIMTATLIGPDPIFRRCLVPPRSEWLFEVRPVLVRWSQLGATEQTADEEASTAD